QSKRMSLHQRCIKVAHRAVQVAQLLFYLSAILIPEGEAACFPRLGEQPMALFPQAFRLIRSTFAFCNHRQIDITVDARARHSYLWGHANDLPGMTLTVLEI